MSVWTQKSQAKQTKTSAAILNSDRRKRGKASINSPIYRRERHNQSTVNMGTKWTNSHQHQQHASGSSMSVSSDRNIRRLSHYLVKKCTNMPYPFLFFPQVKKNHIYSGKNMRLFLSVVLLQTHLYSGRQLEESIPLIRHCYQVAKTTVHSNNLLSKL